MIDGIDSSGKGTATTALKEFYKAQGKSVLDLRTYWKDHQGFPGIDPYDVIIATEPTFTHIGKKIRDEMIRNKTKYTPKEIAKAFSEDRKELYEKIVIPAKQENKIVVQERGVVTSLAYQPLMDGLDKKEVLALEGNQFCLNHAPDLLILTTVDPRVAIERIQARYEKQDDAIFEKEDFLRKGQEAYKSTWIKELLESKGTKIIFLDTNPPKTPEDTKRETVEIIQKHPTQTSS
tara:strand:- start:2849 stop:3550 length:702 start_codon:yes stop_codon:yes gene_type:complete